MECNHCKRNINELYNDKSFYNNELYNDKSFYNNELYNDESFSNKKLKQIKLCHNQNASVISNRKRPYEESIDCVLYAENKQQKICTQHQSIPNETMFNYEWSTKIENGLKYNGLYNGTLLENNNESICKIEPHTSCKVKIYSLPSWQSMLYGMGGLQYAN